MNESFSKPDPKTLWDYLRYQYPACSGDIMLKACCESIQELCADRETAYVKGLTDAMQIADRCREFAIDSSFSRGADKVRRTIKSAIDSAMNQTKEGSEVKDE